MRKFALLSMMLGLLLPSISVANPTQVLVRGGILCDTQEQLETLLTGISLSGGNEIPEVNGCGKFAPEQPVTMIVTPLEWYVTPLATSLIGQFVYFQNGWTQYGWLEYVMNPDYEENIELGEAL